MQCVSHIKSPAWINTLSNLIAKWILNARLTFYSAFLLLFFYGSVLVTYSLTHLFALLCFVLTIIFPVLFTLCVWSERNDWVECVCAFSVDFRVRCRRSYYKKSIRAHRELLFHFEIFSHFEDRDREIKYSRFQSWPRNIWPLAISNVPYLDIFEKLRTVGKHEN